MSPSTTSEFRTILVSAVLFQIILFVLPGDVYGVTITECTNNDQDFVRRTQQNWTVTTLPVGHGDAHVVESQDGAVTVVDAGSTETVDVLTDYLDYQGIETIDRLVITHPHWDHLGGVMTLVEDYRVETLLRPGLDHTTPLVRRTETTLEEKNRPVRHLSRGDTFPLNHQRTATVINPGDDRSGGLNQNSLAFYFSVGESRVLMMGDVIGERERTLLDSKLIPEADLVKIAHHGNSRGTSDDFLETVKPTLAILPAPLRKNDPWGRPDPKLINRLRNFGVPTFHTGRTGIISVALNTSGLRTVRIGPPQHCLR